jgi:hypothetical protein
MRKEVTSKLEELMSSEAPNGAVCFTYDSKQGYAQAAASGYDTDRNIAVVNGVDRIVSEATRKIVA